MSNYNERPGENKWQGEYKQTVRQQPPKKDDNDIGSWIFIAVMFAVAWPIGLILLIIKLSDSGKNRLRKQDGATRCQEQAAAAGVRRDKNTAILRQRRADDENYRHCAVDHRRHSHAGCDERRRILH